MRKAVLFACVVACFAIFFATISTAQYDLQAFETANVTTSSDYLSDLVFTAVNPILGGDSEVRFDFTILSNLSRTDGLYLTLPGFTHNLGLFGRVDVMAADGTTYVSNGTWLNSAQILPTNVDSSLINLDTSLHLIFPINASIAANSNVRIEILGLVAPANFDAFTTACLTDVATVAVNARTITSTNCCGVYSLGVIQNIQASVYSSTNAPTLTGAIVAETCPNFGLSTNAYVPTECTATDISQWDDAAVAVCCQYDEYVNNARCDAVICVQTELESDWNATRCCNVLGLQFVHSTCGLCTPGNFPKATCCDSFENTTRAAWRENDGRCDEVVCTCDDWVSPRCCYQYESSAWYNTTVCPTCEEEWDQDRCCALDEYAVDDRCICSEDDVTNYNTEYCCQYNNTYVADFCPSKDIVCPEPDPCPEPPANPCEEPSTEEPWTDEPSCPCALGDGNCGGSYNKFESHDMNVANVTSGHNTIMINHLHIDAHINANETSSLLPTLMLAIDSGSSSNTTEIVQAISNSTTSNDTATSDDVATTNSLLDQLKQQVENQLSGLLDQVSLVQSGINNITSPINTLVSQGISGAVTTATTTVRQIVQVASNALLTQQELNNMQQVYITQVASSLPSTATLAVKIIRQYLTTDTTASAAWDNIAASTSSHITPFSTSSQHAAVVMDVTSTASNSTVLTTALSSAQNVISSQLQSVLGVANTLGSLLNVEASNECSSDGTCSASCQCSNGSTCSTADQCLAGACKNSVCADASSGSPGYAVRSNYALVIGVLIASIAVLFMRPDVIVM